jgi:PAS domain S-box-containing protein
MSTVHHPLAPAQGSREVAAHFQNTPLAVVAWDRDTRVTRWAGQAEGLFGWTAREALGRPVADLLPAHADDLAQVAEVVREMTAGRRPRATVRSRHTTRGGRVVWCDWFHSVVADDAGQPAAYLSLARDVTEEVRAAEAAAEREARVLHILERARVIGWDWDFRTARLSATSDLAAFFGMPPGTDYGTAEAGRAIVHPADREAVQAAVRGAVQTGAEFHFEYRGSTPAPDGRDRWFATRGQTVRGADGTPTRIAAVNLDITDRKRAELEREALGRQLLDAQKWESLGVLAGGIAHDFNNILTVVLGSAGLARRFLPADSPAGSYLDQIEHAAQRAAGLCREMLAYAGRGPTPSGTADLARVVRESGGLLGVSSARHVPPRLDLPAGLPPVRADEDQVRRVLVNLVMNAGEAVAEQGEVSVRAAPAVVTGSEPTDWFRLAPPPGVYVRLDVTDTGPGIPADVVGRVFDPFFTTKFPGRGLGLAAVLGIVKTHGGGIRLDTAPGRGTTVQVYWPPAGPVTAPPAGSTTTPPPAAAATSVLPPRLSAPVPPRYSGLALVVDDEMYVREVAASTLEDLGYTPVLAGDGRDGLDLFLQHRHEVRVVVLDVVMPGMTGDKVLAAIRAEAPDTPVVLISGYTDRRPADGGATGPGTPTEFLQKPFRPDQLAAALRRVVAAVSPAGPAP